MRLCILFILLTACGHKVANFSSYTQTIVDRITPFPSKEDLQEISNVVIVVDDRSSIKEGYLNPQLIAVSTLENLLGSLKSVKVLDRGILKNIKEELMLAEMRKGTKIDGTKTADYVFLIKLDSLTFSSKYDDRSAAKMAFSAAAISANLGAMIATSRNGGVYIGTGAIQGNPISGVYQYDAAFSGSIVIIKMPSGEQIARIPITSKIADEESGNLHDTDIRKRDDAKMMSNAITAAIKGSASQIASYIPAKGHVMSRADLNEESPALFRVTFGSDDGIKIGDTVFLQKRTYELNQLTNEQEVSIRTVELGSVIENDYRERFCWISVKDKALASTVLIGDEVIVKVIAEQPFSF